MIRIFARVETSTGHRLMGYAGKCSHPHGHSYVWEAEAQGIIPPGQEKTGLMLDFSLLKQKLKEIVEPFDHSMVLREDDPLISLLNSHMNRHVILDVNPTAENLATYVAKRLLNEFPTFFIKVSVQETSSFRAESDGTGHVQVLEVRHVPKV